MVCRNFVLNNTAPELTCVGPYGSVDLTTDSDRLTERSNTSGSTLYFSLPDVIKVKNKMTFSQFVLDRDTSSP